MPLRARYDGYADWYESWNKPHAEHNASEVRDLLGPGQGRCLDLGCGGGQYFDVIAATGRTVVGLDYSADQLRFARNRSRQIVRGDAAALPFADATFPTVVTMWISTDVDDFAAVLAEAARVLTPGGLLAFCGAHPLLQRPAHPVAGRRRDARAPHLPASRLASGITVVGPARAQAGRNAPSSTG
jgi:ubiquinone/menaquinone biosynthesis C-methylase UbiE